MKSFLLSMLGCCLLVSCGAPATYLATPQAAPGLSAPNQDGKMISLRESTSGPWAVVFFYPEADTPG